MPSEHDWLRKDAGLGGDPMAFFELAKQLEAAGDLHLAATAYDRAYGLNDANGELSEARSRLLEQLAVTEHGIRFAYIQRVHF